MKLLILLTSIVATSCTYNTVTPNVLVAEKEYKNDFSNSEQAAHLIQIVQSHDYESWKGDIQRIRNTYARAIKVLEDKEEIQFTLSFFKTLAISETLDEATFYLTNSPDPLPNIDALKYFFKAEKLLDEMIEQMASFKNSPVIGVQYCAKESAKYFEYQKDFLSSVRNVDYRNLKKRDVPLGIPPEVLRANAKLLDQRERMTDGLIAFYANIAEKGIARKN